MPTCHLDNLLLSTVHHSKNCLNKTQLLKYEINKQQQTFFKVYNLQWRIYDFISGGSKFFGKSGRSHAFARGVQGHAPPRKFSKIVQFGAF